MRLHSKLFLLLIAFCFVSVIVINFFGNEQNERMAEENLQLNLAIKSTEKDPNLAISILSEMKRDRPEGFYLSLLLTEASIYAGDYKNAAYYSEEAVRKNPAIILKNSFCLQNAGIAYQNKEIDVMKAYTLQALSNNPKQDEIKSLNEMIKAINELEKN